MKTNRNNITLAIAALAASLHLTGSAAEPLQSPRAKANQIRMESGISKATLDRANQFKHRGDLVVHPTVKGVSSGPNLALENRHTIASPRAVQVFPHLRAREDRTGNRFAAGSNEPRN